MCHNLWMFVGSLVMGLLFLAGCGKERTYWPEREYRKSKPEPITRYDTRNLNHQLIPSTH
jgi:hypothetical protein